MKYKVENIVPLAMLAVYLIVMGALAFEPYDRAVWFSENGIIWVLCAFLIVLWKCGIRFSPTAYVLMGSFMIWHTIGGHYTFERVPFEWTHFGGERNHFDRIAHFGNGLFAWAVMDWIELKRLSNSRKFTVFVAIIGILAWAGAFEIIEWWYAELADPEAGASFLGMQGDEWDAQKDILMALLGAICTVTAYRLTERFRRKNPATDCKIGESGVN